VNIYNNWVRASTLTQIDEQENLMSNQQSIHWLAVGKVSDTASREVVRTGGQVVYVASEPIITLVGIAHDTNAHPDDLAFYHASQIQIDVHSTGLAVVWVSSDRIINAAYSSLTETELITCSEYEVRLMDVSTDVPVTTGIDADAPTYFDGLEDLEDHPF
jgi:hypothetical protein